MHLQVLPNTDSEEYVSMGHASQRRGQWILVWRHLRVQETGRNPCFQFDTGLSIAMLYCGAAGACPCKSGHAPWACSMTASATLRAASAGITFRGFVLLGVSREYRNIAICNPYIIRNIFLYTSLNPVSCWKQLHMEREAALSVG